MWYVIRTFTGREHEVCSWIRTNVDPGLYTGCFVALYEDVYRMAGCSHIRIRRMFDGYIFLESDAPDEVNRQLRRMPEYGSVLGGTSGEEKVFYPILPEEEAFLRSVLTDGLMQVSLVHFDAKRRVKDATGPLKQYIGQIVKLDIHHRRAMIRIRTFGEDRLVKFGLWLEGDPKLERFEEEKSHQDSWALSSILPGDYVIDLTGSFGDKAMKVVEVLPGKHKLKVLQTMFNRELTVTIDIENAVLEQNRPVG